MRAGVSRHTLAMVSSDWHRQASRMISTGWISRMQLRSRQCLKLSCAPKTICCYPKWMSDWKTSVKSLFNLNSDSAKWLGRRNWNFRKTPCFLLAHASRHRGPRPSLEHLKGIDTIRTSLLLGNIGDIKPRFLDAARHTLSSVG